MADVLYTRGIQRLLSGSLDWDGAAAGTVRVLLSQANPTTAGADENKDLNFVSELTGLAGFAELATTNYARQDVASRTVTEDDTNDRVVLDAADNVWTSLGPATGGPTILAAYVYERVGADDTTPADDHLLAKFDIADQTVNSGNFTLQWAAAGLVTGT